MTAREIARRTLELWWRADWVTSSSEFREIIAILEVAEEKVKVLKHFGQLSPEGS